MSTNFIKIEGSTIRKLLRDAGLPGGSERICCGGRVQFSRDYATQLKTLKMRGKFKVLEKGVVMDTVVVP